MLPEFLHSLRQDGLVDLSLDLAHNLYGLARFPGSQMARFHYHEQAQEVKHYPEHLHPQVAVVPLAKELQKQEVGGGHQMQQAGHQDKKHGYAKRAVRKQESKNLKKKRVS